MRALLLWFLLLFVAPANAGEFPAGELRVLFISVTFQDNTNLHPTAMPDFAINTALPDLQQWMNEASYGKVWVTGDAVGPYALPINTPAMHTYAGLAKQAAVDAGVDISRYNYFVIGVPSGGGYGDFCGQTVYLFTYQIGYLAHEFGHTFCLNHSHGAGFDQGDSVDTMGWAGSKAFYNAAQKDKLHWLDGVITVAVGGVYHLNVYEMPGGAQAIRVPVYSKVKGKTLLMGTYYLEYRQPISRFDVADAGRVGVLLHYDDNLNQNSVNLVDGTPDTVTQDPRNPAFVALMDPAIRVGTNFCYYGGDLGVRFSVLSQDSSGATVQVAFVRRC